MAKQSSTNLKSSTTKVIAAVMKTLPRLCVIAIALLLFVGAAHAQAGPCPPGQFPCVLVSDLHNGGNGAQVKVYSDDGTMELNQALLCEAGDPGCTGGGGSAGEGMACVSGSRNLLYVANDSSNIDVYSMNLVNNKAPFLNPVSTGAGSFDNGLAVNGTGSLLYAASEGGGGYILSLSIVPASPYLVLNPSQSTPATTHDLGLGICARDVFCGYGGNIFTTHFGPVDLGMFEWAPNNLNQHLVSQGEILPLPYPNDCANFSGVSGNPHCWRKLSGLAFDNNGNLWVNSQGPNDVGTFEFASGGSCGFPFCPLNFIPDFSGPGGQPIGLTVAPATDPLNAGKILIANVSGGTIDIISPATCTGLHPSGSAWTPGTCHESHFIDHNGLVAPKYVIYNQNCANPDNDGYVEICKESNPEYPVSGIFDFTVTAPLFSSGTIQVPVGECSGAVQVPSGLVTVAEAPTIGDLVSNFTACSYNQFGQCLPDLFSWTLPNLYATDVPVNAGGVSEETLATVTNYAAWPGQLKVCKIAGGNTPVGTEFTFMVTGLPPFQLEAGPADQGGFCELVGTFPANTPVTIAEMPNSSYPLTNVTDQCNACTYSINLPQSSMTTTIGPGITIVSFTNTQRGGKQGVRCLACNN